MKSGKCFNPDGTEEEVLEYLGITPQLNSGRFWINKGDGQIYEFMVELKRSPKRKQVTVTNKMWDKARRDACSEGLIPMLLIIVGDKPLAVCDWTLFEELMLDERDEFV